MLFVDLRGYTRFSETHPPEEVVAMLNRFFRVVVAVVNREGGWVNKFEGDAALCLFGAPQNQPDHADRALRTAAALPRELARADGLLGGGHRGGERRGAGRLRRHRRALRVHRHRRRGEPGVTAVRRGEDGATGGVLASAATLAERVLSRTGGCRPATWPIRGRREKAEVFALAECSAQTVAVVRDPVLVEGRTQRPVGRDAEQLAPAAQQRRGERRGRGVLAAGDRRRRRRGRARARR